MLELLAPLLPEVTYGSVSSDQPYDESVATDEPAVWYRVLFPGIAISADLVVRRGSEIQIGLVRSGSQRRRLHLVDASLMLIVASRTGLTVDRVLVYRPRKQYVREAELDPHQLFVCDDITADVLGLLPRVTESLDRFGAGQAAAIERVYEQLGVRTDEADYHRAGVPAIDDPRTLFHGRRQGEQMLEGGTVSLLNLPDDTRLSAKQRIQVEAVRRGTAHVAVDELRGFVRSLVYPVHYLDFEAFSSPIPPFADSAVWEHIPYLYTVQTVESAGAEPRSSVFCARDTTDCRESLCRKLLIDIPSEGSVVVFGRDFESRILVRLAALFPRWAGQLDSIRGRVVDLSRPFSEFLYYHPEQRGSLSMKTILPILTAESYEDLKINNGRQANLVFAIAVLESVVPNRAVLDALVEYCTLDTRGMVLIVEALSRL